MSITSPHDIAHDRTRLILLGSIGFRLRLFSAYSGVAPDVYAGALGFMRISLSDWFFNLHFHFHRSCAESEKRLLSILFLERWSDFARSAFIYGFGLFCVWCGRGGDALSAHKALLRLSLYYSSGENIHVRIRAADLSRLELYPVHSAGLSCFYDNRRGLGIDVMTFLITSFGTLSVAAYE